MNTATIPAALPDTTPVENGFATFNLPPKLLKALTRIGFTTPTPIQEQAIPIALSGRDILGSAQTGTGKTGAFGIPLVAHLMANPDACALIMTPTRELAGQVIAALQTMIPTQDIRTALLIGGESMYRQLQQLARHPRLIVGTPGRINDHLGQGTLKLNKVRHVVLDETDRMLDMGFGVQIAKIMQFVPQDRQTLLFSATLPDNIVSLSGKYLNNPARVAVGSTTAPAANLTQETIKTSEDAKYNHLLDNLSARDGSVIVFVKTKYGTERMAKRLNREGHVADCIHGDLRQNKRDHVIKSYRDKKFRILVATDVAARGLDIPHIEHVINYDMPQCPEDYIHRIGRTARAGADGQVVNLLTPADGAKWKAIHRLLHGDDKSATQEKEHAPSHPDKRGKKPFWKHKARRAKQA